MKHYWFTIETYVHISIKRNDVLLYNSYTGKSLIYKGEKKILAMVKRIESKKNLYVILLSEKDIADPVTRRFVVDIKENFMGDLIDASYSSGKPVQMKPILTVKNDVKYLKNDDDRSVGEDMMKYLTEISLYINDECSQNCFICQNAYKQFHCCTKNMKHKSESDIKKINVLLNELISSPVINLNIIGGNILSYSQFEDLITSLYKKKFQKTFFCHYSNINVDNNLLKLLKFNSSLVNILITLPADERKLIVAVETLKKEAIKAKYTFIIQYDREFEQIQNIVQSFDIIDYYLQPFYNGKNLKFFKKNVFVSKDEVLDDKPSIKEILRNMLINSQNFGRLTITSDGNIYSNINSRRIGILGKDSIYDVIYKEMYQGKSWRRIRKNVEPCKRCIFFALCPPISNYSYAIGKYDLCHMKI